MSAGSLGGAGRDGALAFAMEDKAQFSLGQPHLPAGHMRSANMLPHVNVLDTYKHKNAFPRRASFAVR